LPNGLWRQPKASLGLRAKNSAYPSELLALLLLELQLREELHFLPELEKGVFPGHRFVGELRSLLVEL
jgi:hypothetical protein